MSTGLSARQQTRRIIAESQGVSVTSSRFTKKNQVCRSPAQQYSYRPDCRIQASGIVVQTQRSMHIDLEPSAGAGHTYEMELDDIDEKSKSAHSRAQLDKY